MAFTRVEGAWLRTHVAGTESVLEEVRDDMPRICTPRTARCFTGSRSGRNNLLIRQGSRVGCTIGKPGLVADTHGPGYFTASHEACERGRKNASPSEDYASLDEILQLGNVSGPGAAHKSVHDSVGDLVDELVSFTSTETHSHAGVPRIPSHQVSNCRPLVI